MLPITEKILAAEFDSHVFTDIDLAHLIEGTNASRYGLVNNALKQGELVRLCRGLYTIANKYQQGKFSQFYLASRIVTHSYVSLESALSFHGWIPERTFTVTSIITNSRKQNFQTPLGDFVYYNIPVKEHGFLIAVTRVKGVVYLDRHPEMWHILLRDQASIRDYITVIGLELFIDKNEGFAFLRQKIDDEHADQETLPQLISRRPLSYPVSLLCVLLRKKIRCYTTTTRRWRARISCSASSSCSYN